MNKLTIWLIAGFCMTSLFGWQYLSIKSLKAELAFANQTAEQLKENRDELAESLIDSEASKNALIADLKHREAVLAARDSDLSRSQQELAALQGELRELRENDEEYKEWSDVPVPSSVIRLLRDARAKGNSKD